MRRKFNKYERKDIRAIKLEQALHGEGLYIYENASQFGDLTLPKPTDSGVRHIGPGKQFQGDNYYMQMVKSHELKLIKELISPKAEKEMKLAEEKKLLLDQPPTVKAEGTVEHVVASTPPATKNKKKINETQGDVLLTEDPMSGVEIIME